LDFVMNKGFEGVKNGDNAADEEGQRLVQENKEENEKGLKSFEPLLATEEDRKFGIPWLKLGSIILMEACGVGYWILSSVQVGVPLELTTATCSFMVFFSSTMSAMQYVMLGMEHILTAVTLA
ncbi:hypothetical protein S83_023243, partial [Arachis hypogaea]